MEGVELVHIPIDCEGPLKPAQKGKPGKPEFLGTRVGVVIQYIEDQAVAVNCPFFDRDNSACNNHGGEVSQPVSCHRLDNVIERGYKFSQADVGKEVGLVTALDDPVYSIVEVSKDGNRLVLQMTEEPQDKVAMIRSDEFENVFVSEEQLDGATLVLQVIRRKDGSVEFTVFKDVEPY